MKSKHRTPIALALTAMVIGIITLRVTPASKRDRNDSKTTISRLVSPLMIAAVTFFAIASLVLI